MFAVEPPFGPGELRFRVFGVPVRVHPFFWVVTLLLGLRIDDGRELVIWIVCAFVSILIHELGHVAAFRYFGSRARVLLYAFGGLAIADEGDDNRQWRPEGYGGRTDGWPGVAISFAGPLAGFVFAALIVAGLYAAGASSASLFGVKFGTGPRIAGDGLDALIFYLLQVNILWGLINLLPVYPLDGGQIARELLLMVDARTGIRRSLILSVGTGGIAAAAMIAWWSRGGGGLFHALLFGSLAYSSFVTLRAYDRGYGGYGGGYGESWRDR